MSDNGNRLMALDAKFGPRTNICTKIDTLSKEACRQLPLVVTILFISSALFLFASMPRVISVYDEGLILVGAERVGSGEMIHKDFYANYGPAQFYCLAFLFKLFSPSVLVERFWDAGVRAAIVAICFGLILRLGSFWRAAIGSLVILVWLSEFYYFGHPIWASPGYPIFPALFFALLSVYCFLPLYLDHEGASGMVAAGLAAGLVTLFRYDIGFLVVAAEMSVALTYLGLRSRRSGALVGNNGKSVGWLVLLYAACVAIPTLPIAVWYGLT
jgi:hypothetical protein